MLLSSVTFLLQVKQNSKLQVTADQSTSGDDSEEEWFCGDCGCLYQEETEEPEIWIECSLCSQWFHCSCEGLSCFPPIETDYICLKCQK